MSTLILSKEEMKTLKQLAREHNISVGEAMRLLIRKSKTGENEAENGHRQEVAEPC